MSAPARPGRRPCRAVTRRGDQAGFPALVAVILSLGLVGLLAVNTAVAEDAFRLHELRRAG